MEITKTIFRIEDQYGFGLFSNNIKKNFSYNSLDIFEKDEIKFFKGKNFKKFCNKFSFCNEESYKSLSKYVMSENKNQCSPSEFFKNSFRFGCNSLIDLFQYVKPVIDVKIFENSGLQINSYTVDSEFVYSSRYQSFFCIDRAQKNRIF